MEARFGIFESTLAEPNYRHGNFKFEKKLFHVFFKKKLKKSHETSYLENYKELNSHIWRQDLQHLREP